MNSDVSLLIIFGLFGVVCFYFVLISIFYHQKSGQGIPPLFFYIFSGFFFVGQLMRLGFMPNIVSQIIGPISIIIGGIGLSFLSISLYRIMMSVQKSDQ